VAQASFSPFEAESVRGYLHKSMSAGDGMALTHGAGGDSKSPLLLAVAGAFHAAGVTVLRCDLPFRQQRPSGPPRPGDSARDRAGLRAAVGALREIVSGRIFLAGQSYGGRQASMLAAEEPDLVDALMLLSYPLHPPGKPAEMRTAHFPQLRSRAMFVQGSHDPFGSIDEMEAAVKIVPAPHKLIVIEGAGHDLKRGKFDLGILTNGLSQLVADTRASRSP
jgi:predicted alpha/beta-hydrolase family hydrolase